MNEREKTVYKGYLEEEAKFLKGLERNIQDHINRLKVEELSLLKLISNASNMKEENQNQDVPLLHLSQENENGLAENSDEQFNAELKVNRIPLDLDVEAPYWFNIIQRTNVQNPTIKTEKSLLDDQFEEEQETDSEEENES